MVQHLPSKHEVLGLIPALQKGKKKLGQSVSRLIIQYLSAYRMPDLVLSTEHAVVNRQGVSWQFGILCPPL